MALMTQEISTPSLKLIEASASSGVVQILIFSERLNSILYF